MGRTTKIVLVVLATALGTTGSALAVPPAAHPAFSAVEFTRYTPGADGITYDEDLVRVGADAVVLSLPRDGGTEVTIWVRDLVPHRGYGVHVHQKPCGPTADAAGPHYQNVPDPVQPSVDPAYANPRNEIWLDLTTDERGTATSSTTVDWQFVDRHAGSVVLHAEHTHTGPGHAGTAGARLACVTVGF